MANLLLIAAAVAVLAGLFARIGDMFAWWRYDATATQRLLSAIAVILVLTTAVWVSILLFSPEPTETRCAWFDGDGSEAYPNDGKHRFYRCYEVPARSGINWP